MIAPTGGRHGYDWELFLFKCAPYIRGLLVFPPPVRLLASWPLGGISRLFLQNLSPESELSPQAETERATRRASGGGRSKTTIGRPSVGHSRVGGAPRARARPPDAGNPLGFTQTGVGIIGTPFGLARASAQAWQAGGGPTLGPPSSMGRFGRLRANGPLRICQKRSQPKRLSPSRGTRSAEEGHF